ncbi:GNAT family N-acetyltransferase [Salidesulfovibrio onnuriiensis]|uniref:GNAT family N-acetyltransferase n=1 Tax=Salidesulfovibrio onnuriiensis TaxID=2583823 RepID=UPI0011CAFEEA|nr:GNAT family N-acetyltransferase [Salidesulfovibrio onnuriiensis]
MPLTIRRVAPADLTACAHVESVCFEPSEAASEAGIGIRIDTFPQGFLVAELDGKVVGQINSGCTGKEDITDEEFKQLIGHDPDGSNMVVFSLSVLPEAQGKGAARALMERFIADSRAMGKERILLLCKDYHIGFYEKLGYEKIGLSASTHGGFQWWEMALAL